MSSNFCSFSEPQHGSERVADTLDFPSARRGRRGQGAEGRGPAYAQDYGVASRRQGAGRESD